MWNEDLILCAAEGEMPERTFSWKVRTAASGTRRRAGVLQKRGMYYLLQW